MNIEKLKKRSLNDLNELKTIIETLCEDYAKTLTTYATVSADPMFQKMPKDMENLFYKRNKYVEMNSKIKTIIEEKIDEIYNEK